MRQRVPSPERGFVAAGVLALILASSQSCSTTPRSDIEGEDNTFFGALRVSAPFDERDERNPEVIRFGVRVDVEVSGGDFDQTLSAGEVVQLDDVAFTGPGEVSVDFDHTFAGLGVYVGKDATKLDFEGMVGLGGSFLDAEASMGGLSESTHIDSIGAYLGGSVSYRVVDSVAFFYEMRLFFGGGTDDVEIFEVQLGATWTLTDHLALSAGWKDWDYGAERDDSFGFPDPSDLDLGLDGPFVRLELGF